LFIKSNTQYKEILKTLKLPLKEKNHYQIVVKVIKTLQLMNKLLIILLNQSLIRNNHLLAKKVINRLRSLSKITQAKWAKVTDQRLRYRLSMPIRSLLTINPLSFRSYSMKISLIFPKKVIQRNKYLLLIMFNLIKNQRRAIKMMEDPKSYKIKLVL
jgi:hypothetical protein